jgi:hypothetical protein
LASPVSQSASSRPRTVSPLRGRILSWALADPRVVVAVLFGVSLRLGRYLFDESLFNDETSIALDVLSKGFAELTQTLSFDQVAPVGFLFLVKLSTLLFGPGESALRFVPLVAGILSVLLFSRLARRVLEPSPALAALGIFGGSWILANYAHFVKQYSTDVAVTAGILLAAVSARPEAVRKPRALMWLALVGGAVAWLSHPALFVLASVAVAWMVRDWREGRGLSWTSLVVPAFWAASFLLQYELILGESAANTYLVEGWREAFLPMPPRSLSDWFWTPNALASVFAEMDGTPVGRYGALLSLALAALGGARLYRTDRFVWILVIGPVVAALVASALRKYPFSHRLVLFLYPNLILLLCAGLGWIRVSIPKGRFVSGLLVAVVLGPLMAKSAYGLVVQPATQDLKPLLRVAAEQYRDGDLLWIDGTAGGAFEYYRNWLGWFSRWPAASICAEDCHRRWTDASVFDDAVSGARRYSRVWLVISHIESRVVEDERRMLERFDGIATRRQRIERRGASLTLYEVRR